MDGRRMPLRGPFDPSKYGRPPPRAAPPAPFKEAIATQGFSRVAEGMSALRVELGDPREGRPGSYTKPAASLGTGVCPDANLPPQLAPAPPLKVQGPYSSAAPLAALVSSRESQMAVSALPPHLRPAPVPSGRAMNKDSEVKGEHPRHKFSDSLVSKAEPAGLATPGAAPRIALGAIPIPKVNGTGISRVVVSMSALSVDKNEKSSSALPPHMRPTLPPVGGFEKEASKNSVKGPPPRLKFSDAPAIKKEEPKDNSAGPAIPGAGVVSNPISSTNGSGPPTAPRIATNVNTNGLVFTAWPVAERRGRAPAQKRSVLLQNLSPRATLSDLSAICKNTGIIERFDTSPLPFGRTIVHFVDQETADRFLQRTGNGLMYKNTCVFVEPQAVVDVLSGRLREAIEKGARRIIRIVGIEDTEQLKKAYKEILGGSVEHLKGLDETALLKRIVQDGFGAFHIESVAVRKNKAGYMEGRIVWGKTDLALKAFPVLRKLISLEGCNIQYFDDPCDTISLGNPTGQS